MNSTASNIHIIPGKDFDLMARDWGMGVEIKPKTVSRDIGLTFGGELIPADVHGGIKNPVRIKYEIARVGAGEVDNIRLWWGGG